MDLDLEKIGLGALVVVTVIVIVGVPLWLEMSGDKPVKTTKSSTWISSAQDISYYGDRADLVVIGDVESVTDTQEDGIAGPISARIYETVTIDVDRVLKGEETEQVTVHIEGEDSEPVEDAASYSEDEHILAFLVPGKGDYVTLNGKHGKFDLADKDSGEQNISGEHRVYELQELMNETGLE